MDTIPALQILGFSEYEARAYVALVRKSPMNGYELAKVTSVPRPNIYGVLEKLAARHAVLQLNTPEGVRYAAVAPDELINRLAQEYERTLTSAKESLHAIGKLVEKEYVWNGQGYDPLISHARYAVQAAKVRLLVGIWPTEARELSDDVSAAEERGVEIITLCMAACAIACGSCHGQLYRYRIMESLRRSFLLVADGNYFIGAEITSENEANWLTSQYPLVVELASAYIRNMIAICKIIDDLGPRLEQSLPSDTRRILSTLGPFGSEQGFLEHMRAIIDERIA